jgi:MFS family permease
MRAIEETAAPAAAVVKTPRPWTVFASGPFRNLWAATTLSLFGDFFSVVAIAWLTLQLTGSSLALGSVLVVGAIPRGVLMILGGAVADRLSPRLTMFGSMALRALLVAPLAVLVISGRVQMWEVYAISFVFGAVDAFFLPARSSVLPKIVADHELEPGNAVLNVTGMLAAILAPALAGVVVTAVGTGWAFAADAACFALGVLFVLLLPAPRGTAQSESAGGNIGGQIVAGIRYVWNDVGVRAILMVIAVIDFAAVGALDVGIPTLAHDRYGVGATGLGVMLGAWGVGATLGAGGAGFIKAPTRLGLMLIGVCVWIGVGIAVVGVLPTLVPAAVTMAVCGISTGAINTYGISWLQRRVEPAMQGRVMALVMTASTGLAPVALALAGVIAELNTTLLFVAAGALIVLAGAGAAVSRTLRAV